MLEQEGMGCEAVFRLMTLRAMCGMKLELYREGFYLTILSL